MELGYYPKWKDSKISLMCNLKQEQKGRGEKNKMKSEDSTMIQLLVGKGIGVKEGT